MKYYYKYDEFKKDINQFDTLLREEKIDCIVAIARGGLTFSHFLAEKLNIRNLFSISSIHYEKDKKLDYFIIKNIPDLDNYQNILVVDDISDTGETLKEVMDILKTQYPSKNFKTATLFYKDTSIFIPDFTLKQAKEWIVFFWEE